jgi:hypothetical protein
VSSQQPSLFLLPFILLCYRQQVSFVHRDYQAAPRRVCFGGNYGCLALLLVFRCLPQTCNFARSLGMLVDEGRKYAAGRELDAGDGRAQEGTFKKCY